MDFKFFEDLFDFEGISQGPINERHREYLTSKGFTPSLNQAWFDALRSIGGQGAIDDMFYQVLLGQIDINNVGASNSFFTSLGEQVVTSDGNRLLV